MNLKLLKENYTFDKYLEIFGSVRDKLVFPDQDLLNYVHYEEVKLVDRIKYGLFTQTAHKNGMTYEEAKKYLYFAFYWESKTMDSKFNSI